MGYALAMVEFKFSYRFCNSNLLTTTSCRRALYPSCGFKPSWIDQYIGSTLVMKGENYKRTCSQSRGDRKRGP